MSLTKVSYSMIEGTAINVADYGAVGDWNGSAGTDNTSAFVAAIAASANNTLYVPKGTFLVGNLTIPNTVQVQFDGIIHVKTACTVQINGTVLNNYEDKIFSFTDTPTNLSGSPVPISFSQAYANSNPALNSKISINWFGATGDWNGTTGVDNTVFINAAFTSVAQTGTGGFNGNSGQGACTVYVPRGRYYLSGSDYLRMPSGCLLLGEFGGSTAGSAFVRQDGIAKSMLILQGGGVGGEANAFGSQHFIRYMNFQFKPTLAENDNTQINTGVIEFADPVSNIDTIIDSCWFLESPRNGSHIRWGNKNLGITPSAGLAVFLKIYNTVFDVCYGKNFHITGAGFGSIFMDCGQLFESKWGNVAQQSSSSTLTTVVINNAQVNGPVRIGELYAQQVSLIPGNLGLRYSNCEITGTNDGASDYGFGFRPAGGTLEICNSNIYATKGRLLVGQSSSTSQVYIRDNKIDYSSLASALPNPNTYMWVQNAARVEVTNNTVYSTGAACNFFFAQTGFGDVSKLMIVNNTTDLGSGTIDVSQSTSQVVITNNVYSTTANVKTLP